MSLVVTELNVYEPTYDSNTGTYVDKSPFKHRSRNNQPFECRCKLDGKSFTTNSQFQNHCNLKSHQHFITHYDRYFRDSDKAKREIRDLKVVVGKQDTKLRIYSHKLSVAQDLLSRERKEAHKLRQDLQIYESRMICIEADTPNASDTDDEFQDC
jgi:hypothetical protein